MNHRDEKKRIYGQIIFELREKNNMTQTRLGNLLDINSNAISKWENGLTFPNEENIIKLNKIFNVSIENIYNNRIKQNGKNLKIKILKFIEKYFICLISIFIIIIVLFIILLLFYINNKGKCNYYSIENTNFEYNINGSIVEMPHRLIISLSNITSITPKMSSSNYETSIYINDIMIYKIGDIEDTKEKSISLNEYLQSININLSNELMLIKKENLDGKQLIIKTSYIVNNEIKTIKMKFLIRKAFSNNKLFYCF